MSSIRALHQFPSVDNQLDELVEAVSQLRKEPGCSQAEAYVSGDGTTGVVIELWQDTASHGRYWSSVDASNPVLRCLSAGQATSEFYRHQQYIPGATWIPVGCDTDAARIVWPAMDSIRIILSGSADNVDGVMTASLADTTETRREPGCVQFDWFFNSEFPTHFLLLELWRDQAVYDAHWQLRLTSGAGGAKGNGPPPKSIRQHGSDGFEFYRHEPFTRLYDRWLPTDIARRSRFIVWPA
jgi:quinol monooxygenase YgiN